ncbi:MAG: hypothetical protein FWG34_13070 [Oscillospiraceae bacterium]|nr:hypothetical protein [Oscillospiraceae bacterium]
MKKFALPILICIIIPNILFSCKSGEIAANDGIDKNPDSNIEIQKGDKQENQKERLDPDLPEKDFGGYNFTFFAHRIDYIGDWVGDGDPRELVSEEENGEPINDMVYKRNLAIKEKYNVNIEMKTNSDDIGTLRKAVSSGDNSYDAAVIFNNLVPGTVTNGLLVNVENLPYIDLNKPWWDPAAKSMSVANQNFLMAGDLLILDNEATTGLLFNKDMMVDFAIELPYQTVKEGKWTMDALNGIVKGAAMDLNGDGIMGPEDRWGFVVSTDTLHALLVSGGGTLAAKDKDDLPYMDFTSPKNLSIIEKAMDLMYNPEYAVNVHGKEEYNYPMIFEENRILYIWIRMRAIEFLRGMESNFGIVPMPKYDEAQEKYYSVVNPYTGVMLGVPKSAEDLERASIILEALSAESRYTLQPAYYETVLQRKYTRDEESGEMLDIIFNSRIYDIGGVYSFGNVFIDFIELSRKNNRNVMSYYEKNIGKMENAIDKVVEIFKSMD